MKQGPTEPSDCLSFRQAKTWVVLGLSATFFLIGALFILAPRWGATLFGIPSPEDRGLAYVQAIGFRDLALALYIIGLALFSSRRALSIVLAFTVLMYRPRFVRHRIACYAARAADESWLWRMAAGVWNPCRSMSQVVL